MSPPGTPPVTDRAAATCTHCFLRQVIGQTLLALKLWMTDLKPSIHFCKHTQGAKFSFLGLAVPTRHARQLSGCVLCLEAGAFGEINTSKLIASKFTHTYTHTHMGGRARCCEATSDNSKQKRKRRPRNFI